MFCVTVTPASRTLAKVDLLNAARTGDMIELCLDHLIKEPDFGDLLEGVEKPVILSCRRPEDGGQWDGSEADRIMLLKRAIVAGPHAIELDPAAAAGVPRFGEVKRVVAFTSLDRPLDDPEALVDEARGLNADVVKFSWPMQTLEEGWPLLKLVAGKRSTPVVGMGRGREGVTFTLLANKFGAPWAYAALERGMEAYEGQATIGELSETFAANEVGPKTALVAVTGFGPSSEVTVRTLNDAFRRGGVEARCLPIPADDAATFPKRLDALKIKAVLSQGPTRAVTSALVPDAPDADVFLRKDDGWKGFATLVPAALKALESQLKGQFERASAVVLGATPQAASMARELAGRGGVLSVCSPDDKAAAKLAAEVGCRHLSFAALYGQLADVLVLADPAIRVGDGRHAVRAGYLRPEMTVVDLTDPPVDNRLMHEARRRGCRLVDPLETFDRHMRATFKTLSGGKSLAEESRELAKQLVKATREQAAEEPLPR